MSASLTDSGIRYFGSDWGSPSGGDYHAGFQTFEAFRAEGPLREMPEAIAAAVTAAIAARAPGHPVRVEASGPPPQEAHLHLDGQPLLLRPEGAVLFEGSLPAGAHTISGVLLYAGSDARGRRNAGRFEHDFRVLPGERTHVVVEPAPRWGDAP